MTEVFRHFYDEQQYVLGCGLEGFEKEYAKFSSTNYCVGVANGHDALLIILKSLEIGLGDEVIIPAHTFIATALSIKNAGAKPVLVDIDKNSLNIDPNLIEDKITEHTKAIVPVHLYGNPSKMDEIMQITNKHNLYIVEDNAQAHGAKYNNHTTGSMGIMNFTSFYPTKNLGALGDGGAITTNSRELYEKARAFRNYGKNTIDEYSEIGINSRLHEFQARVLYEKLKHLESWNSERHEIAQWYREELMGLEGIKLQKIDASTRCAFHIFPILSHERSNLKKHLKSMGVETLIHYEKPIHFHESFSFLGCGPGDYPVAEKVCASELSLPIYPGLKKNEVKYICQSITSFLDQ